MNDSSRSFAVEAGNTNVKYSNEDFDYKTRILEPTTKKVLRITLLEIIILQVYQQLMSVSCWVGRLSLALTSIATSCNSSGPDSRNFSRGNSRCFFAPHLSHSHSQSHGVLGGASCRGVLQCGELNATASADEKHIYCYTCILIPGKAPYTIYWYHRFYPKWKAGLLHQTAPGWWSRKRRSTGCH